MTFDMKDYVDVAERIAAFTKKYPDGTLQPADPAVPYRIETIGADTIVTYVAAAYRTPDDARPGIGVASEIYPGKTPYTKGSELMNAETSAWGRAIVAIGIPTKKVASSNEVRNRQAERDAPVRHTEAATDARTPQVDADSKVPGRGAKSAAHIKSVDDPDRPATNAEKRELGQLFHLLMDDGATKIDLQAQLKKLTGKSASGDLTAGETQAALAHFRGLA